MFIQGCNQNKPSPGIRLITLDPGHFHAALVQKSMYAGVDSTVYVYAPEGSDLELHLERINSYNGRTEDPTHWQEVVYRGDDFFAKMLAEKKGNVVVLSGNNQKKTDYILQSLQNGMNVLADKPMVINTAGFEKLKIAFETARENGLLLYDIMTERFEINTMLQRELSLMPEIFGELEKGTDDDPAITKESVHHLYKYVSGSVLTRPAWFLDVTQQGEGIVDVMTHLVDLVQWECFPGQVIDYKKDIQISSAGRSPTTLTLGQFREITRLESFPDYLGTAVQDTLLHIFCNGEINYTLKGIHAKTSVKWNYKAPEGTGDTHYSRMRGTKCNLIIRQGKEENFEPVLYIEPTAAGIEYERELNETFKKISTRYPGVEPVKTSNGWRVQIPDQLKEGHEAHFARVTRNFLDYLKNKNMPDWEEPNMLAKYYLTTLALDMASTK